jgi:hypothetical protein
MMHRAIAPWLLNWLTHHDARGSVTGGPAVLESTFICNVLRILRECAHVRAFHDILIFFFRQCFIKESKKKTIKVKYTLQQAMKAQVGSRGIALLFLCPRREMRWVVNATPRSL